ncbi:MAG TPA: response regulator transcription factor [Ignavibacteriaceae bacterium]|nr:response regulator transcription factor [Ignavibacteriaceae bacterium]
MKPIKVILADDHKLVRAGIKFLLEDSHEVNVIGEASNGREAIELTGKLKPDMVFLDIAMPELNGLEAAERIKKEYPAVEIIILSMYVDEEYVIQALNAGASGYLLKDSAPDELRIALDTVVQGKVYISPAIPREMIDEYTERLKRAATPEEAAAEREKLTSRQKEVLQLIAEGNSTKEIAAKLFLSIKTVETHRAHIMKKLGINDIPGLVKYAIRKGMIR